jgi:hypothetical protein
MNEMEVRAGELAEAILGLRRERNDIDKHMKAAQDELMEIMKVLELREWSDDNHQVKVVARSNRTVKADEVVQLCPEELATKLIHLSSSVYLDIRRP